MSNAGVSLAEYQSAAAPLPAQCHLEMKLAPPLGFFPFPALSNEAVLHSLTRSDALLKKA